jgi:hypothetical protein
MIAVFGLSCTPDAAEQTKVGPRVRFRLAPAVSQANFQLGWCLIYWEQISALASVEGSEPLGNSNTGLLVIDRKIAARLFRRFPRPVKARIIPDSYFPSMGAAFTETA